MPIEDEALILRRVPWRESSWVVHALCAEHGHVALVAKGARRLKSPLRGALEPLHAVRLGFRPGKRGMGLLVRAVRGEALMPPERWPEGLAILAVAARAFPEGSPCGYRETRAALEVAAHADARVALVAGVWRLLAEAGWIGALDRCWQCGAPALPPRLAQAGLACARCAPGLSVLTPEMRAALLEGRAASEQALARLRRWLAGLLRGHGIAAEL